MAAATIVFVALLGSLLTLAGILWALLGDAEPGPQPRKVLVTSRGFENEEDLSGAA